MAKALRLGAVIAFACSFVAASARAVSADEGWTIRSFDVTYEIERDGLVNVTEDILVDFGPLFKHGIFREMPVRYHYDDENDRLISVGNVEVDNGEGEAWQFETIFNGTNLRIKIGDPDIEVTGVQRYRISYLLTSALNPFDDHDELYWNVTGDEWPVDIDSATAVVRVPGGGLMDTAYCYQGPRGATELCSATSNDDRAEFSATRILPEGSGMTIVAYLEKGAVDVSPPVLVPQESTDIEKVQDAFALNWWSVVAAVALGVIGLVMVIRQWWIQGRDRWYGDLWYANDGVNAQEKRKPMGASETVIVEFEPPPLTPRGRPLRPAEIGVLLDESADTLDVTATIIDLAVRNHIKITETKSGGFLGLFKSTDYQIDRLTGDERDVLPYEQKTLDGLFKASSTSVTLSSLENKFYKDLGKIKESLYREMVKENKLFPRSPDSTRTVYRIVGVVIAVAGAGLGFLLAAVGGSLIAIPVIITGLLVFLIAPAMPRRTGRGRTLYQRSLGFRKFMVTAEKERQAFAERKNIFHEYLPYAIVYDCVEKWAEAFEGLADIEQPDWYVGTRPFVATSFAHSMSSFSSSISSSIASTPGGSGGSGGGGGGSSGGGGGGGGGGSW
ncbi:MAG: DUF2207 domain-containing protein [Dehalococcoidia bacterium]